ncbi:ubiquitin domain-containing protein/LRR_4 domain-containing protein/LRR_8 domain-containing protein [Cephalotus follicularis]|uniref:Ubiquitin domain-containing protein/LRR_4 domain-containing protein/LRR_8 domain-containing protein n=1 Tax=Cephalotus follicularis TaxID=3775 RepID=A0A1Q3BFE5_CEPFO|nr:ubiquitin domain-containing protein/LRR_4 domain-containing protein/LRR_8 domain-containing protein [Cephalotus follicularis]
MQDQKNQRKMEMRDDNDGGGDVSNPMSETDNINFTVKFSGRLMPIAISIETKIKDLKFHLLSLTNVLPRGQKLIFKGKVLMDTMTLKESEVKNGAKIMLIASQGLHQGDGPILKEAKTLPISRESDNANKPVKERMPVDAERWKFTGIVALADRDLKSVPDEVWAIGASIRVLDIRNNFIQIPAQIRCLSTVKKMYLDGNGMSDESIFWEGLTSLKRLKILSLTRNQLTSLPSSLGGLASLRRLYIDNNKLTGLPIEIGLLTKLEVLKATKNRIRTIPTSIGDCNSLIEVDLSSNHLSELPETFGNLHYLKALRLKNNGLKSLPHTLLKECRRLSTLDLHNTEVTMNVFRQLEGWEDFEGRRRMKHQKQLDFLAEFCDEFDEGADQH